MAAQYAAYAHYDYYAASILLCSTSIHVTPICLLFKDAAVKSSVCGLQAQHMNQSLKQYGLWLDDKEFLLYVHDLVGFFRLPSFKSSSFTMLARSRRVFEYKYWSMVEEILYLPCTALSSSSGIWFDLRILDCEAFILCWTNRWGLTI